MDVTQVIVAYSTHGELEGILRNEFGLGDKSIVKRGQKTAKISENDIQIEYALV